MRVSPEALDGQFVIPVIDPEKYACSREIAALLSKSGICAVFTGEEASPVLDERPLNLDDMFPNDDCSPVYGSWMLPHSSGSNPEEAFAAVREELERVHGFSLVSLDENRQSGCHVVSRNLRRSVIWLSLMGKRFNWDYVTYGDQGLSSIEMETGKRGITVHISQDPSFTRREIDG